MKKTANFCTLHDAFTNRTFFVPMYQRQYAWDEPQLEDFWRDLRFLESLEESKSHYLGNLVISERRRFQDIYDNTLTRCEVIDGQQRLMTIVLLANQLTQRFSNEKQKRQREHYVFWQKANGQEQTRVRPQESERDFFHALLKGEVLSGYNGAQRRFIAANRFFRERLTSLSDEEVSKLFSHLTQRMFVTVFVIESFADAMMLFESLNDRGCPLRDSDKAKNYLMYVASRSDPALVEEIRDLFGRVYNSLSYVNQEDMEDRLLDLHLQLYAPKLDPDRPLIHRLKELFPPGAEIAARYQETLERIVTGYSDLHDGVCTGSESLKQAKLLANFLPILLAVYVHSKKHDWDILDGCEALGFKTFLLGRNKKKRAQYPLKLGRQIFAGTVTVTEVAELLAKRAQQICPRPTFEHFFLDPFQNHAQWSGVKFLLYQYLLDRFPTNIPWKDLTVEHIMPKKTAISWVNNIGNLTLVTTATNRRNADKPFAEKKSNYAQEPEAYLGEKEDWGEVESNRRRDLILEWALENWRVE